MLSCKETSQLVSQSLDRRLTLAERIGVRVHLFICKACGLFTKQIALIRATCEAGSRSPEGMGSTSDVLSAEARARIARKLQGKTKGEQD
jgi:hypothetical protein